jgi:phage gp29-like protein
MPIELDRKKPRQQRRRPDTRPISTAGPLNRFSSYPSAGLTPERLSAIFREADEGNVARQSELFEEILEKDPRLFGMFESRRLGVAKNEGEVIAPGKDAKSTGQADYCRELIERIRDWRQAKEDILDAVPKGFSALQIMWMIDGSDPIIDRLEWTHQRNFRFGRAMDPKADMNVIYRLTDENRLQGIPLEPDKWVIPIIKARSGHPARTSILRTCSWMYLFKNFNVKSWIQFAELFAMPLRIGKYMQGAGKADIQALIDALQNLALDSSAVIPNSVEIEFKEAMQKAAGAAIFDRLAQFTNGENSVAVLGHTGAAESTPGKLGENTSALESRADLIEADALAMDYIISDQILRRAIDFKYGPQDRYPYYKTHVQKPINRKELVEVYDGAINRIRIPVSRQHVYETLGIPQPKEGEEVILPHEEIPPIAAKMLGLAMGSDKKKDLTGE